MDDYGDDYGFPPDIAHPEPACRQNLVGWQRFFGLDLHARQVDLDA